MENYKEYTVLEGCISFAMGQARGFDLSSLTDI